MTPRVFGILPLLLLPAISPSRRCFPRVASVADNDEVRNDNAAEVSQSVNSPTVRTFDCVATAPEFLTKPHARVAATLFSVVSAAHLDDMFEIAAASATLLSLLLPETGNMLLVSTNAATVKIPGEIGER